MRLSIKAMRYFLVAADHGSIARAAEDMHVVPSAISNAIEQVETEFDLKLIQRSPAKGIAPTATGLRMMQKLRRLVEDYDTLMREGTEMRSALSGGLSIGYYAPIAPAFMPAIAGPLIRDNPDFRLNLVECDNEMAQAGLLAGKFDLILFVADKVRTGIEYELLIEAPPYLLVPASHLLADAVTVDFPDIAGEALVLLDLPFTSQYYRGLLEEFDINPRIAATASTTEMVRALVGAGTGVSILNMRPLISASYGGDELVAVPISATASGRAAPLRLVLGHTGGKQRRLVTAFSQACQDYFASSAARSLIVSKTN